MIKVNKKNKVKNKTFEFLTVFSMTFGIVVGSGIYLKNSGDSGVLAMAGNNPYVAIAVWIFMGVFCSLMLLTFLEVSSAFKKGEHNTVSSWSKRFVGRRFGSFTALMYVALYMPVLVIIGALFVIHSLFESLQIFVDAINVDGTWRSAISHEAQICLEIFLGLFILVGFQLLNIYTEAPSRWIQAVLAFVKFIPLIMVIVGGITLFATGQVEDGNSFEKAEPFKVNTIFATMVPIMFAFDGFLDSAAMQKDCEHKEVVAPAMMTGIIAVVLFYLIISVSIFIGANDGNILNLFDNVSPTTALIFKLIITATLITMINAYTIIYPLIIRSTVEEKLLYTKNNGKEVSWQKAGYICLIINLCYFAGFVGVSLLITNGQDYFEASYLSADTSIIIVYAFYLVIMMGVIHNRRTNKIEVQKGKYGFTLTIITASILTFMLGYIYYLNIIQNLINGDLITPLMWFAFIIILTVAWIINECLLSKQDIKNNDFYLRIQPKNWFNYDKEKEIKAYLEK